MGWLNRKIERAVTDAVADGIDRHLDTAIDRAIAQSPVFQFLKAMQMQMLGCDPKMKPRDAWRVAQDTLRTFREEEECEFGDPRFDWSREGAIDLIHEYEIHHWESTP